MMKSVALNAPLSRKQLLCTTALLASSNIDFKLPDCPKIVQTLVTEVKKCYPKVSASIILPLILVEIVQALTTKRIRFKEVDGNVGFPNIYAAIFMPSGFGKDRILKDLKKLVFKKFREWVYNEFKTFKQRQMLANAQMANGGNEQEVPREMVLEITDGTKEGLFSDAEVLLLFGLGAILFENSEFGNFIVHPTLDQKQLFNQLYYGFDNKIISKSTQGKPRKANIEDVPVNVLLSSDPTLFEGNLLKESFNTDLKTGLMRRLIIGYQTVKESCEIERNAKEARIAKKQYSANLKELGKQFFQIFESIELNSVYELTDKAYDEVLYPYLIKLEELEDEEENYLLSLEINSRELKVIKLAAIYACLNHPQELFINSKDVKQAIDTIEFLSIDVRKFLKLESTLDSNCECMFDFFLKNIGKEYTATDLKQSHFKDANLSKREFGKSFEAIIEGVCLIATSRGYFLNKAIAGNSGFKYSLITLEAEDLDDGASELEDLI